MGTRKPISKRLRFEVFKRDKFTCQYCGQKAPDIVLQVDHIDPVANGGDNNIINLITSCFECNNGKRDKKLDDNSVVEKQRRQLEILQERREQIELMLEWKKSLATFDNDVTDMIVDYINNKIKPLSLNENGKRNVSEWLRKFSTEEILDGVDEGAKKYLKYDNDELNKESAELFLSKIAGVIIVKGMPPVKQKVAYIKGIARNRFGYWDDRKGSIIINNYLDALENQGWDEHRILNDLELEVMPLTKESNNWSQWKNTLEGWTEDIKKWDKPSDKNSESIFHGEPREITLQQLESFANYEQCSATDRIDALVHIGTAFENFNQIKFKEEAFQSILSFIYKVEELYRQTDKEINNDPNFVINFIESVELPSYFDPADNSPTFGVQMFLYEKSREIIADIFNDFYLPRTSYKRKDIDIMLGLHRQYFEERCASR